MPDIALRPARPADAVPAAGLIHDSGPAMIEYGFSAPGVDARAFVAWAFRDGRGFFGSPRHTVATVGGEVAGIAALYAQADYGRLARGHAAQVAGFYPWARVPGVLRRSLQLRRLMPPPAAGMLYVAHLAVAERLRGRGIGRALLAHARERARALGLGVVALDVALDNPRARALYAAIGFRDLPGTHAGLGAEVPGTVRMEQPA